MLRTVILLTSWLCLVLVLTACDPSPTLTGRWIVDETRTRNEIRQALDTIANERDGGNDSKPLSQSEREALVNNWMELIGETDTTLEFKTDGTYAVYTKAQPESEGAWALSGTKITLSVKPRPNVLGPSSFRGEWSSGHLRIWLLEDLPVSYRRAR